MTDRFNKIIKAGTAVELYLQVLKTAVAAALSWFVVTSWLHWPYPYFAPLAAILTVQVTISESIKKAWQRLLGTIGGVAISAVISQLMSIGALSISIGIIISMTIGVFFRFPPYINSQAAVSSLMVLAFSQSSGYGLNRITETIIGSVIGVLANIFIFPPNAVAKAEEHILSLSKQAASSLGSLGSALQKEDLDICSPLVNIANLEEKTVDSIHSIQLAHKSLLFNPLMGRKRHQLCELTRGMQHLENISIQIRGIRRGLISLPHIPENMELDKFKKAINLTETCITDFGINIIDPSAEITDRLKNEIGQAITAQNECLDALLKINSLTLTREIGAILTDLRRIIEEVNPCKHQ
jgi:uncharacterized membrane protein YgaE (UPF0421/DUF939 family)